MMDNLKEKIKEFTLMLLYLNSWVEKDPLGNEYHRSWKGYDFDVLNELSEENLIIDSKRSKSIYFSDVGAEKALELLKKNCVDMSKKP